MANHTYCIELMEGDHDYLLSLSKSRTIQAQIVEHAKILLQKEAGKPDKSVAEGLCINVNTVSACVQKYLEGGTQLALYDRQRKGRPAEISPEAVAWIINLTCQRPADLGIPRNYEHWRSSINIYKIIPLKQRSCVLQQFQKHGFSRSLRSRKSSLLK